MLPTGEFQTLTSVRSKGQRDAYVHVGGGGSMGRKKRWNVGRELTKSRASTNLPDHRPEKKNPPKKPHQPHTHKKKGRPKSEVGDIR